MKLLILFVTGLLCTALGCNPPEQKKPNPPKKTNLNSNGPAKENGKMANPDQVSEDEWKKKLTKEQYYICRLKGTERPGSGKYNKFYKEGTYECVACGTELFSSGTKYDSGSGWPSFYDPTPEDNVKKQTDTTAGMTRTEILCKKCGPHLAHVFDDGPEPTGKRYCVNSLSLKFVPKKKE